MSASNHSQKCCSMENQRLKEELRSCDYCSSSWEEHHRCLQSAARKSGERARKCIIG